MNNDSEQIQSEYTNAQIKEMMMRGVLRERLNNEVQNSTTVYTPRKSIKNNNKLLFKIPFYP